MKPIVRKAVFPVASFRTRFLPVTKAMPQDATSNLASIGRYLLTPDVFDILRDQSPGYGGEGQLVDAIDTMAAGAAVCQVPLTGRRFDCGWLEESLYAMGYATDHEL
jgi:UTP--glucose-1-phosphate uridylyltransferase